ncbi:MAG: hypothetical protein R3359_10305 [Marinirhabdus sp.]|nr:hypothetical protein [Marinirhabdus sp.]
MNSTQNIKNVKELADEASSMQENMSKLQKIDHLTKEQWQSWLPETLYNLPITSSQINFLPGLGSASATYSVGNKRIRVMVIDGAGEKGANAVGAYRASSKIEYNDEGNWGSTKTVKIDNHNAKLSDLKNGKYSVSMFYNERFAVDIETHELPGEALEQIIEQLNLNELKNL